MKKRLAIIIFGLVALITISLLPSSPVYANEMSSIEFDIELQRDGSGIITETRRMNLTRDTEIYIILENLQGSEVTDFHVSDFGEPLTYESDWDISASHEEKAGKYGIVETWDGVELAWGIGEYGDHEYTITYTISDMVRQLEDGQGMNWKLFDEKNTINPGSARVSISGPEFFTTDDTLIWGFGFDGEVYLEDGKLTSWSNGSLSGSNHVTILMQFLTEPFNLKLSLDQTLSEQQEIAKKGSSYTDSPSSDGGWMVLLLVGLIIVPVFVGLTIIFIVAGRKVQRENPLVVGQKRIKMNEDQYYRDIPYEAGPMTDVAYLLQKVNTGKLADYFNAFMLKWLKEERLSVSTEETGRFFKKEQTLIKFDPNQSFESEFEQQFWEIITSSTDSDGILYDDELKKSARKQYKDLLKMEKDLKSKSDQHLIDEGYLEDYNIKVLWGITHRIVKGTERGEALFNQLVQFKNYLADFSLLSEREMKEVALWDDLLIWASLYGIADQVAEQLEKFYPDYYEQTHISYTDVYMLHLFSRNMGSGYSSAANASSGGGGSTSVGGGGGSFGGGGGGSR